MVGEIIKKKRAEKGWTIKQLAEKAELSFVQVNNVELNKNKPNTKTLLKLATALDCDYEELYLAAEQREK